MKLGYPCINRSLSCKSHQRFMLKSYSESKFLETTKSNLECLQKILEFNQTHNLLFFRISSDLIPFASHPVCTVKWSRVFAKKLQTIGAYIREHKMRISMHPDQFVVLNSPKDTVVQNSIAELEYHATLLDALELDDTHKIQVHLGGVYGDKRKAIDRFIQNFPQLSARAQARLAIENDDRSYSLHDCVPVATTLQIPVIFDTFHHELNNSGESLIEALRLVTPTWNGHGAPMIDYASQEPGARVGKHCTHINQADFRKKLQALKPIDPDIMLEIKDKERSALEAITLL